MSDLKFSIFFASCVAILAFVNYLIDMKRYNEKLFSLFKVPVFASLPGKFATVANHKELASWLGLGVMFEDRDECRIYMVIDRIDHEYEVVRELLSRLGHPDITVKGRPNALNVVVTYVLLEDRVYRVDFLLNNMAMQTWEQSTKNLHAFRLETNLKQYAEMNRLQRIVESAKRGA